MYENDHNGNNKNKLPNIKTDNTYSFDRHYNTISAIIQQSTYNSNYFKQTILMNTFFLLEFLIQIKFLYISLIGFIVKCVID